MDRINYTYLKHCQNRYMECLHKGGVDTYFADNRVHGYVTGKPLNEQSNCFIVVWRYLLSVWFNPLDGTVYIEARYSEDYSIFISGIYSMRNMKTGGCLMDYPLLSTFGPAPLKPDNFNDWVRCLSRGSRTLLSIAKGRQK